MNLGSKTFPIRRYSKSNSTTQSDVVAIEEPLEIRIGKAPVSVTMRTPGQDIDLVRGFLFTEGFFGRSKMPDFKKAGKNRVDVIFQKQPLQLRRLHSRFFVSTSCGLCGRMSVTQVKRRLGPIKTDQLISAAILKQIPCLMRDFQETFGETGGLHAAALFDVNGQLLAVREDVGRHNAVDKAIGSWIGSTKSEVIPMVLLVSGRASFEIIQKALAAKIPIVAAISAPSSLAVELAREASMTLIGFLRDSSFNVYSRADRIQ